jgi:hypothetical protein
VSTPVERARATAARARVPEFAEQLALAADAIGDALAAEMHLVAWDREQLVGLVQSRLQSVWAQRPVDIGGLPARVLERADQPLEALEAVWSLLLQGRRVLVQHEEGACLAALEPLFELARGLPTDALVVEREACTDDSPSMSRGSAGMSASQRAARVTEDDPSTWPRLGVVKAVPRVAWVDESADRELAAYVLARTCLRRAGMDPRGVKVAYVAGGVDLLERHLRRLWVGAQFGPASDPVSFAGPVDRATRDGFVVAHAAWCARANVKAWCEGGVLDRTGDDGHYLAPAAFVMGDDDARGVARPRIIGPMLVIVRTTAELARAEIEAAARDGAQVVQVGGRPIAYAKDVRLFRGAVLVERLPPGLPEPRPV